MTQASEKAAKPDFEKCLSDLQKVVEQLENGNLPLDQSLQLFAQGVELVRSCQQHLQEAEKTVELLLPGAGDKLVRKPFAKTGGNVGEL